MADQSTSISPILRATGLGKSYGATVALRDVDLSVGKGEVVALLGENGAGKSTFSKIVAGVIPADRGRIAIDGSQVSYSSPREAARAGVAYIPQELSCLPHLSVAENLVLGEWPTQRALVTRKAILVRAEAICRQTGIDLPLRVRAGKLRLADLQQLEIAKALSASAKIVLLDEPTAALSEADSERLFALVRRLADQGVGIVFVSHRLDEVRKFSHRVIVFRDGAVVANLLTADTSEHELVEAMLGEQFDRESPQAEGSSPSKSITRLRISDLSVSGVPGIDEISFDVDQGEVVAVYGLRGSGASLLGEALGGQSPDAAGTVEVDGTQRQFPLTPLQASAVGIGYVPADRKREGLFQHLSVQENLVMLHLSQTSHRGIMRRHQQRLEAERLVAELGIRCQSPSQKVSALSGGNQQKVLIGSRLVGAPKVLVLQEPTRGVDVGARADIHSMIRGHAGTGASVLVVTSDLDEVTALADRVLIVRDGRLAEQISGSEISQARVAGGAAGTTLSEGISQ